MPTATVFAPLSPAAEALAQVLAASLVDPAECAHEHTTPVRGNAGDGSPAYDYIVIVCAECGQDLGDSDE